MKLLITYAMFFAPCHFLLLGPNSLTSTLFLNSLNLFSLTVKVLVSHSHKTTNNIIVLHILILTFLDSIREIRDSEIHGSKHSLRFLVNYILICYHCSQISELWHVCKGFVGYLYTKILSYDL
jgi:hypothetical protein